MSLVVCSLYIAAASLSLYYLGLRRYGDKDPEDEGIARPPPATAEGAEGVVDAAVDTTAVEGQ